MLGNVIAAAKSTIVGWARTAAKAVRRWARPAGALATAVAGIAHDATRSRCELLAENAFLRQQLIVLRRSVKRPALGRGQRLILVVLARCIRAWRDALHLVQPDTLLRWHRDLFKFNASRPHQGIAQRIPGESHCDRPVKSDGRVAAMPILGGLHHDYRWAA